MDSTKFRKQVFEKNNHVPVKGFERKNTRVSEYLRKYGTGHLENVPTDNRPEMTDDRNVDEMLADGFEPAQFGTDALDVLAELDSKKAAYEKAVQEIELTKKERQQFDELTAILNDPNASDEKKYEVMRKLDLLTAKREKRARAN